MGSKVKKIFKNIMIIILLLLIILSNFKNYVFAFSGEELINKGKEKLGSKYVWGAGHGGGNNNPNQNTFDCSSFVSWVVTQLGYKVDGTTETLEEQFKSAGLNVQEINKDNISEWQVGDVVFLTHRIKHVGFYAGDNQLLHAPGKGDVVKIANYNFKGVTKVLRIADGTTVVQQDLSKYRTPVEEMDKFFYKGLAKGQAKISAKTTFLGRIVNFLKEIVIFLLNFILFALRLPFIGITTLIEVILTYSLEGISGQDGYILNRVNSGGQIDERRAVTLENIITNRIEIFNTDIFVTPSEAIARMKGKTAAGGDIEKINELAKKGGDSEIARKYEEKELTEEDYKKSPIGLIRAAAASAFYLMVLIAIGVTLILGMVSAIRAMVGSIASKKASAKDALNIWITTIAKIFISIFVIVFVVKFNSYVVDTVVKMLQSGVQSKDGVPTFALYETVRTRAYAVNARIGIPATVLYISMIWYTVQFLIIYIRRLVLFFMLLVASVITPVYDAFQRTVNGKSKVYGNWLKEMIYVVMLQSLHVIAYAILITMSMNMFGEGFISTIFILFIFGQIKRLPKDMVSALNLSPSITGDKLLKASPTDLTKAYIGKSMYKDGKKRVSDVFRWRKIPKN